jgi:hypothetical protein
MNNLSAVRLYSIFAVISVKLEEKRFLKNLGSLLELKTRYLTTVKVPEGTSAKAGVQKCFPEI